MLAAGASNTSPLNIELFLDLRRRLTAFAKSCKGHGATSYVIADAGLREVECVETFRQDTGEDDEAFLMRVWVRAAREPHATVTWTIHEQKWSAKITRRMLPPGSTAEIEAQLDARLEQLAQHIGRLAFYTEQLERFGAEHYRTHEYPLEA